jgi:small subunit ribosomal protein S11
MAMAERAAQAPARKRRKKKVFKKRGEKRVVHHGVVHIQASFNNTLVTITDAEGNVCRVVERRRHRLQGIAQGHAVCRDAGGHERRQRRQDVGMRSSRCA